MFRKPTNREGLLSDADHYSEAARCQRRRASEAKTPGLRGECIARAILFEDKARQRRQEAKNAEPNRRKGEPLGDGFDIPF